MLDHEDVKRFQRAHNKPVENLLPTQVKDYPWIYALRKAGTYPKATARSGKWLIFVSMRNVDEVWRKVKQATEEGRLGGDAKVATMYPNPIAQDSNVKVICVYTYDWQDKTDVYRVCNELLKIGIKPPLGYKADSTTLEGKYAFTGDTNLLKWRYPDIPKNYVRLKGPSKEDFANYAKQDAEKRAARKAALAKLEKEK